MMAEGEYTRDFFVSYIQADKQWAEWVAWQLEDAGYSTIIQAWDFTAGSNFVLKMNEASSVSRCTVPILSPDYLKSDFASSEWAVAFASDPKSEKGRLMPIRVKEFDVIGLLGQITYIDFVNKNEQEAKEALFKEIKQDRSEKKPKEAPDFPNTGKIPVFPYAGSQTHVFEIQHRRNPNFIGREEKLKELEYNLSDQKTSCVVQAIAGLGGVGKTQIAVEYCSIHKDQYQVIWWFESEEKATLEAGFLALARNIGIEFEEGIPINDVIRSVYSHLDQAGKWLLVFDNVPHQEDLKDYLPMNQTGHIIATSRDSVWKVLGNTLELDVMDPDEAVNFLKKRTGEEDEHVAAKLAEELGYLPLALEQAGAYIESNHSNYTEYLGLFQKHKIKLFEKVKPLDYKETVATIWNISFEKVREESSAGADLLNLCAFFAPDDISLDTICTGSDHLPEPLKSVVKDTLLFNEALSAPIRYSLIERTDNSLSVHRLVQEVTRTMLSEEDKINWATDALQIIAESFNFQKNIKNSWQKCLHLLPHAISVSRYSDSYSLLIGEEAALLNYVGGYFQYILLDLRRAKMFFNRALNISEQVYGTNHYMYATSIGNIGLLYNDLGNLRKAKKCCEISINIDEIIYGPDSLDIVGGLINLGYILQKLGDFEKAKEHFVRAKGIQENELGSCHPEVASTLNHLGLDYRALGDSKAAMDCFMRAKEIEEMQKEPNFITLSTTYNNLGLVCQDLCDYNSARRCYEQALRINEKEFGSDHPQVAKVANNLGTLFRDLGELNEAKEYYERALRIYEQVYGPDYHIVATIVNNLGSVLCDLGELKSSMECFMRAQEICIKVYGPDHSDTATIINNIGAMYKRLGNLEEAKEYFRKAFELLEKSLGLNHPTTKTAKNNLDGILRELGES